jgi:hypothetical protein
MLRVFNAFWGSVVDLVGGRCLSIAPPELVLSPCRCLMREVDAARRNHPYVNITYGIRPSCGAVGLLPRAWLNLANS